MMETESAMNRVNRNRQKILPERNVTMKFFHLSDLHIGLKLMNRDLREDQEYILSKIVEAAGREETDAVVIAGDIYDKAVPSAEAVEVFDRFLEELTETVPNAVIMMISGNHDSAPRGQLFSKCFVQTEGIYDRSATENRGRIYRKRSFCMMHMET